MFPNYRYVTQKFNMDDIASKGSAVHPIKKNNRVVGDGVEGLPAAGAIADSMYLYLMSYEIW